MASSTPTVVTCSEIRSDQRVQGTFLVRRKTRGVGRTGKPWLQLILGDRTGTVDARIWDRADEYDRDINENDVVWVDGRGVSFMDKVQLKVLETQRVEGDVDPEDFLPVGHRSAADLEARFHEHAKQMGNRWLRTLYESYLGDERWWRRFSRATAAKSVHHAYIGGLAEHTLSMMDLARSIGRHYVDLGVEPLNVDLLVVGAFVHDTGKIEELSTREGFAYTDKGRLWGHIVLGLDELDERIRAIPDFPEELRLHLRHLLLSHHGEQVYGSPTTPKTIEAMLLHHIDNLDARVEIFHDAVRNAGAADGDWTGYEPTTGRHVLRKPLGDEAADADPYGDESVEAKG